MKAIECKKLNKSFGSNVVLDNVDLLVEEGEFFGLVGMNGSGKSTMIKAMLDLVSINSGQVFPCNTSSPSMQSSILSGHTL